MNVDRKSSLPVPQKGFFDTEQYWRLTPRSPGHEISLEQSREAYKAPENLGARLNREADKLAAELISDSCVVPLYLGGKGRVLGTRFAQLLRKRVEPSRIVERGDNGAINLNSSVIMKLEGFESFRTQEVILPENRDSIRRHVWGIDGASDQWMAGLRAQFRSSADDAVRAVSEANRGHIDYLLVDDQQASGLTATLAEDLLDEAIAYVRASTGKASPSINVHKMTDLAPDWEHVPSKLVGVQVEQLLPAHLMVSCLELPGVEADAQSTPPIPSSTLRKYLTAQGVSPDEARAVSRWISHGWYEVKSYVIRGGFADKDDQGTPLLVQRPNPGHVISIARDHQNRPMQPLQIDVKQAVELFNQELDELVLTK